MEGKIQDIDEWVNTERYQTGLFQVECPKVSGCTLLVEGCDDQGGSFTTLGKFVQGATAASMLYLKRSDPFGSSKRLAKLIRWRIDPAAGAWEATFRLNLLLK